MPSNLRFIRIPTLVALALVALTLAAVTTAGASGSVTRTAKTCSPPVKNGLAYLPDSSGYFTSAIKLTKVSCAYGRKFVVAYWRCRTSSGKHPAGRCTTKVQGFSCKEKAGPRTDVEINATVTCRRGGTQRIVHSYQQNLDE
jgi:hypothetical protein